MTKKELQQVPVSSCGGLEKFNEVISKGRCRTFYKGENRNGTYITDEFAEKLLSTIKYTPVKGIYDKESGDFTDHGNNRDEGRIYGIVPEDYNFAWEKHLDEDGVEREYACVDVLYYTGIYDEAAKIAGKSQSMELYGKSIKGAWKFMNGKKLYVYDDACFLGLQALGDNVEPCFEGAEFYTKVSNFYEIVDELFKKNDTDAAQSVLEGGQEMPQELFKLSDDQKRRAISMLLNSETDEDGYFIYKYSVIDVYDEYALVINYMTDEYERIYYTKDDSTDSVEITDREKCYIIDVTETEKQVLKNVREANGGTFERAMDVYASVENLAQENSTLVNKTVELNEQISTLNTEKTDAFTKIKSLENDLANSVSNYEAATTELEALRTYKKQVETSAKLSVIDTYTNTLREETLEQFRQNIDEYASCEELDMKLTYALKRENPDFFCAQPLPVRLPKDTTTGGIESILARYENK